ncbi:E3 ubiquitin-protein ligase uhrf1 [Linnemannia hyalina]|uniref:E3 ubiquitin-protein ligase uhrf1 n=1 Tax=Linnemannia hyalina TaxID=64524 RepID=A0A9P7Y4F9_9FUNG|nr:E3 ubiquitin-protein ligase uhrf1 [Linnemannia hyalina]
MKVNFHLIQQPDRVESFFVPSINTTIKRVRERIAEQYDVDENAFYLYYQDNQLNNESTLSKSGFVESGDIAIVPITYIKENDYQSNNKVALKSNKPPRTRTSTPTPTPSRASSELSSVLEKRPPYAKDKQDDPARSHTDSRRSTSPAKGKREEKPPRPRSPPTYPPQARLSARPPPSASIDMRFAGPIPGIPVGSTWPMRIDASRAGVHRPAMAGISGQAGVGAESVVLSRGYMDDDDKGYEFTYTGAGGNTGGKQTSHQELTRANHGLAMTCDCPIDTIKGGEALDWHRSHPIRVIRGYQLLNMYSPKSGYRYDGIYKVVKYWPEKGKAGFTVWRYLMRRDDLEPAPWETQDLIIAPSIDVSAATEEPSACPDDEEAIVETILAIGNASRTVNLTPAEYRHLYPLNNVPNNQGPNNENQYQGQAEPSLSSPKEPKGIDKEVDDSVYQLMCVPKASDGEHDGHIGRTGLLRDDDIVVDEDAGIGDAADIGVDGPDKAGEKTKKSAPAP